MKASLAVFKSVKDLIKSRVLRKGGGWVFTPVQFLDLGSRKSVDMALARLTDEGTIRRIARGLYDYPKQHPKLGPLSPSPDAIANALSQRDQIRLQPTGAYAMNLLGLSQQIPAQIVYLTDATTRTLQVGTQVIQLKRSTPKMMATAGKISGLVIQAFRYLGNGNITRVHLDILSQKLTPAQKKELQHDYIYSPTWMHPHLLKIAQSPSKNSH
jgi:hypothetical protein